MAKRDDSDSAPDRGGEKQKIQEKPASSKAPSDITTLGVSPIRTIKGPSIHNDKPVGPKTAAYYDGTTADQSSGKGSDTDKTW